MRSNTAKRLEPILAALRAGKSRAEVATEFGYSYGRISQIAQGAGIPIKQKNNLAVVRETLKEYSIKETAERLGLSYGTVWVISERNGINPPSGYKRKADRSDVIASARGIGIIAASRLYGITCERVRQICVRHEAETGEHIERKRRDAVAHPVVWPQIILCAECRAEITIRSGLALERHNGLCQMCSGRRRLSRRLTYEVVEKVIAERLAGGRSWNAMALAVGYKQNAAYQLTRAAFIQLRRGGRRDEINQLWPKGLPKWLQEWDRHD